MSDGNYDVIEGRLLKDFEYNPSLLYELMKIIFMKSTTEQSFLEIYVRLCVTLFKKFKSAENKDKIGALDLARVLQFLGQKPSKSEVNLIIWEVDDDLD